MFTTSSRVTQLLLLLAVLPFLALCWYNQPYADDFIFGAAVQRHGLWPAQAYLYTHWNGRVVSSFVLTAFNPLSYGWIQGIWLPTLGICLLTVATLWFLLRSLAERQLSRGTCAWLAVALFVLYASAAPDVQATLYWFSSQGTHHVAALLLVVVPVAVVRAWRPRATPTQRVGWLVVAVAGTVAVAGFSELVAGLLGYVLLIAAGLSLHRRQHSAFRWWLGLLLVLGGAALIDVFSPSRRYLYQPAATDAHGLLRQLWQPTWIVKALSAFAWQPQVLLLLLVPVVLAPYGIRLRSARPAGLHFPLWLGGLFVFGGLVFGTFIMQLEPAGDYLLGRCADVLVWWLLLGWLVVCWAALPAAPHPLVALPRSVQGVSLVLLVLLVANPTRRAWQELLVEAPTWAKQTQQREVQLAQLARTAPGRCVEVEPIMNVYPRYILIRGEDLQPYYNAFFNRAVAGYYGLDSVRVNPQLLDKAAF